MRGMFEKIALKVLTTVVGHDRVNQFIINRLVKAGRSRPHPWSTLNDYISWRGLSDRTFNARLLPPKPYPADEMVGTRRPPVADITRLFEAHPAGQRVCPKSTMLFAAFAQYLTDGFIRTKVANDPPFGDGIEDRRRTTSNHDIDMSPLYGRFPAQTDSLRLRSTVAGQKGRLKSQRLGEEEWSPFLYDATGALKPEFATLDQPLGIDRLPPAARAQLFAAGGDRVNATPQVAMMNTLWLREHNRLAAALEAKHPDWDDDRVFEVARNIIIWMFIKIVVEEYINHISTTTFRFRANPEVAWEADWNRPNWMTAEFSLLYRWHSLVPETVRFGSRDLGGNELLFDNSVMLDAGLAGTFVAFSANPATQLGLGNSPSFLTSVETKAIAQARTLGVASYNDYRRAMNLDAAGTFDELVGESDDPPEEARRRALAVELERLYGDIENVEFYVGLFAEPPEVNGPLPELLTSMVAMDAFSQALTNPLLSRHVMGDKANRLLAFDELGIATVTGTRKLADVVARNTVNLDGRFVGMTRPDWQRE